MVISLRLSDTDGRLYKQYAATHGMTLSEFLRKAANEKIEESYEKEIFGIEVKKTKIFRDNPFGESEENK